MQRPWHQRWSLLGLLGAAALIAYLFSSAFQSAVQYYVTVAELQAAPPPAGRTLKVAGYVARGSVQQGGGAPVAYRFVLAQDALTLPVSYEGLLPDTFHEGGEVVATGHLGEDGTFQAEQILAKCASKYRANPETAAKADIP